MKMKVSVIGLGYIGLPTATLFASRGIEVVGVDVSSHVVETINQGRIHIVEPGLEELVKDSVSKGKLRASLKPEPADAFLIAVPTPFRGDHEPDIAYVKAAVESIAPVLEPGNTIILESTSPVGTTLQIVAWLRDLRPELRCPGTGADDALDIHVAYCPERVLPGRVVEELVENSRVIGGMTPTCSSKAAEVYKAFVKGELVFTDAATAEMCKLTENAFRDVNIAFANEISLICNKFGVNVWELIALANRHPRVNVLRPGCGVGGHCIAVDPWFLVASAPEHARMIATARHVNDSKPEWVISQVDAAIQKAASQVKGRSVRVVALGLAFKPDIDDLRESPALKIAVQLAARTDIDLMLVEPHVDELPASLQGRRLATLPEALAEADVAVVLVPHRVFKEASEKIHAIPHVIDVVGLSND